MVGSILLWLCILGRQTTYSADTFCAYNQQIQLSDNQGRPSRSWRHTTRARRSILAVILLLYVVHEQETRNNTSRYEISTFTEIAWMNNCIYIGVLCIGFDKNT